MLYNIFIKYEDNGLSSDYIERNFMELDKLENKTYLSIYSVFWLRKFNKTFRDLEVYFREIYLDTYLVPTPINEEMVNDEVMVVDPVTNNKCNAFALFQNGDINIINEESDLYKSNLDKLAKCGILTSKDFLDMKKKGKNKKKEDMSLMELLYNGNINITLDSVVDERLEMTKMIDEYEDKYGKGYQTQSLTPNDKEKQVIGLFFGGGKVLMDLGLLIKIDSDDNKEQTVITLNDKKYLCD